jgi:hypothetical protein
MNAHQHANHDSAYACPMHPEVKETKAINALNVVWL